MTDCRVLRVIFEQGRASALEIVHGGETKRIAARREIIVSCGTVNSPALLMHSGIGDPDALAHLGIPVIAASRDVGRNLQDHLLARVEHVCTQPVTLYDTLRGDRAALALLRALMFKTGPAASFPLEAGAFLKSDPALDTPDLQSHFLPGLSTAALRLPFLPRPPTKHEGHGFFANIYQLRPESRGEITLRSADPCEAPAIRPNYLSSKTDRRVLREGVKLLRRVMAQAAFDPYRGLELSPGPGVQTDDEIEAWLRETADTVFHPIGTCRMGADPHAVLDEKLRVRGVRNLRVVDASSMPTMPSSNTHAPTMMIAERAAEFILAEAAA